MDLSDRLFRWKDPYDLAGTEKLFCLALAQSAARQRKACADYDRILALFDYDEAALCRGDLSALPPIPTLYFKHHVLYSMPEKQLLIKATSSGTGGVKSRIGFDAATLRRGLEMSVRVAHHHGLLSAQPCHYLILGYQPRKDNETVFS